MDKFCPRKVGLPSVWSLIPRTFVTWQQGGISKLKPDVGRISPTYSSFLVSHLSGLPSPLSVLPNPIQLTRLHLLFHPVNLSRDGPDPTCKDLILEAMCEQMVAWERPLQTHTHTLLPTPRPRIRIYGTNHQRCSPGSHKTDDELRSQAYISIAERMSQCTLHSS